MSSLTDDIDFMSQALLDRIVKPYGDFLSNGITISNPQIKLLIKLYTNNINYRKYYLWRYTDVLLSTKPDLMILDIDNLKFYESPKYFINFNTDDLELVKDYLETFWIENFQDRYSGRIIFNSYSDSYWLYAFVKSDAYKDRIMTIDMLLNNIIQSSLETQHYVNIINLRIT